MQHSLRSFLRLRLRCPASLANRLAALWAGWQAPQRFSAWRCTARFGGRSHARVPRLQPVWNSPLCSPRESPPVLRENRRCLSVPGYAWLDRTDSKQASACWSVSVGGLPLEICPRSLEICGFSPASAEVENATAWRYTARFGGRFPVRVEFQACFRQKPTAAHFSFTAMAFLCP